MEALHPGIGMRRIKTSNREIVNLALIVALTISPTFAIRGVLVS